MNLPPNAGDARDLSLIPGSGRSPGVGNGNPLQYRLENSTDKGAWCVPLGSHGVTKGYMGSHATELLSTAHLYIRSEKAMAPHSSLENPMDRGAW